MSHALENLMYQVGQVFLLPTLMLIVALFIYAFYALGVFAAQSWQRRSSSMAQPHAKGYPLVAWARSRQPSDEELDVKAHKLLEIPRVVTRVAPMLGLVATMIPMGAALEALAGGDLRQVSSNLTIAFSAVILALLAAAITYWIVSVRKRWLAEELVWLAAERAAAPGGKA